MTSIFIGKDLVLEGSFAPKWGTNRFQVSIYTWNPNGSPCFVWSAGLGFGRSEDLSKIGNFHGWGKNVQKITLGDLCDSANGQPYTFHPLACVYMYIVSYILGRYILCILTHSMANL